MSEPTKPYETPAGIIENNLAIYNRIKGSLDPQDVIQCIKLALNIKEQAFKLSVEANDRRNDLVKQLQEEV